MKFLSRLRRAFRWRLRSLLLLVALVGLGVGVWSNDVSRARVYHLLGREHDAWLAAIQAPRSAARDHVLVAALASVLDEPQSGDRRAAFATLSCLAPESLAALPALERALTRHDGESLLAVEPLAELSRVEPEATRVLLAHRDFICVGVWDMEHSPLNFALVRAGGASYALLEAAFLQEVARPQRSDAQLYALVGALAQHGGHASALARPLALLAADLDQSEPVRTGALEALTTMKAEAEPAIPELLPLLIDEFMEAGRFRRALFALFVAIGEPARPHTQAFIQDLGGRWQRWDESDLALYVALAPSQDAALDALRRVAARRSTHITTRAFAGKALRGIDPSAPELLPLTGDILMRTTLEYEWSNGPALEFVMAADLTTLRMIPKWLPEVDPHLALLHMLQEAGPALAPIRQELLDVLPLVAEECRGELLVLVAALAPPDSRLRELFHDELRRFASWEASPMALAWLLRVGPDEEARQNLLELVRGPCRLSDYSSLLPARAFHQEPSAASRDLLRDLATRFLGSENEEVQRTGAILLANIEPEGATLHAWLARRFSETGDRSIAASLTYWLGPRARALTPVLFRQLLVREHSDGVTRAIRRIEERLGTTTPAGDSPGGFW